MVSETVEDGEDSKDLGKSSKQLFNISMVFNLQCIYLVIPKQPVTTSRQ